MVSLVEDHDITHLSGYHTRAQARYFFEVRTREESRLLPDIYAFTREKNIPFLILGSGLNCLFAFDMFPGVVVKNALCAWSYDAAGKILHAESQAGIWDIAETIEEQYGNPIWHRFIGLPGSIGGALYGNAGCFGLETESNFTSAHILDLVTGEERTLSSDDMHFSYRSSMIKEDAESTHTKRFFIIDASFDLSRKREKYASDADVRHFRETKQPKGNTCGSFFKNPSKEHSAGALIEGAGLRGFHLGTASFSEVHANFLMSEENGSWKDLLSLIELAQKKVHDQYGIMLVPEVQILST